MGPEFKVIKIDPEGSGMDYDGHLGAIVKNASRCCRNCSLIFGTIGKTKEFGPFVPGELKPLNRQARILQKEINKFLRKLERSREEWRIYPSFKEKLIEILDKKKIIIRTSYEIKKGDC